MHCTFCKLSSHDPLFYYARQEHFTRDADGTMVSNLHHLTADDHRTNNDLEGWHKVFNEMLHNHKHGIWGVLEKIQLEHQRSVRELGQVRAGALLSMKPIWMKKRILTFGRLKNLYDTGAMTALNFTKYASECLAY